MCVCVCVCAGVIIFTVLGNGHSEPEYKSLTNSTITIGGRYKSNYFPSKYA